MLQLKINLKKLNILHKPLPEDFTMEIGKHFQVNNKKLEIVKKPQQLYIVAML